MKVLLLIFVASVAQAQLPTFILAGKMNCAARILGSQQIQFWCTVGTETRFNSVFPAPVNVPNTKATGYLMCYNDPADSSNGEKNASIVWSFFASLTQPGKVDWQAVYTNDTFTSKIMTGTL